MTLDEPPLFKRLAKEISWKHYLFMVVMLLTTPQIAHEAIGAAGCPCVNCAWNAGLIKAPVIIETIITPPEPVLRVVKKVKWFGNGTCVPYARYRTGIMLYGNAGTFLDRAERAGYTKGTEPVLGGMVITNETTGHVAVVEKIEEDKIYISEQNVEGAYIVSNRWLDIMDKRIVGFIY